MSDGVMIFEGMVVGVLDGDCKARIDDSGELKLDLIVATAFNVVPIWLRIASDNINLTSKAAADIEKRWNSDLNDRKEMLVNDLEGSVLVAVSCGIVFDALYDQLRPYAKITDAEIVAWKRKKTSRAKQVVEIIRRVYKLDKDMLKAFKLNISEIFKARDLAVHPSLEIKYTYTRPDIFSSVDFKFAMFRHQNSKILYMRTCEMLGYLMNKKSESKEVNKLMDNVTKTLIEFNVLNIIHSTAIENSENEDLSSKTPTFSWSNFD